MRARNVAPGIFDENFLAFPAKLAAGTGRDFCLPPLDRGGSDVYGEILTDPPSTSGIIIEEEVVRSEFFEFSTSFPRQKITEETISYLFLAFQMLSVIFLDRRCRNIS